MPFIIKIGRKSIEERTEQIAAREKAWETEKKILERKNALKREKLLFKQQMSCRERKIILKFKKPNMSKALITFLFANCTFIELFSCFIIYQAVRASATSAIAVDFSPLTALIGAVVTEVIAFAIYSVKAMKENTKGGITYDAAMRGKEVNISNEENNSI